MLNFIHPEKQTDGHHLSGKWKDCTAMIALQLVHYLKHFKPRHDTIDRLRDRQINRVQKCIKSVI